MPENEVFDIWFPAEDTAGNLSLSGGDLIFQGSLPILVRSWADPETKQRPLVSQPLDVSLLEEGCDAEGQRSFSYRGRIQAEPQ